MNIPSLLRDYIAAGFDPARFWEITPRLFMLEMDGAAERQRHERAMVWWGAMMPRMKEPPKFAAFVDPKPKAKRQSRIEMQAMCDALAATWGAVKV